MPDYSVYLLGPTGRLERGERFQAVDDETAIATVLAKPLARPVELWAGGRRLGVFAPSDAQAASKWRT